MQSQIRPDTMREASIATNLGLSTVAGRSGPPARPPEVSGVRDRRRPQD